MYKIKFCPAGLLLAMLLLIASLPAFGQSQSFAFTYQPGGASPPSQSFSIVYPSACLLSAHVNGTVGWLNAYLNNIPISATGASYDTGNPATLKMQVTPAGLAGTYTASIQLSTPGQCSTFHSLLT
jgi:hypothetical protein